MSPVGIEDGLPDFFDPASYQTLCGLSDCQSLSKLGKMPTENDAGPNTAESFESAIGDIDTLVVADKLQLLYRQSLHTVFSSLVAASLWATIMWPVATRATLTLWIVAMLAVSVTRAGLFFAYHHYRPEGKAILAWRLPYMFSLFLSAGVWGSAALVTPGGSLLYLCITYVFLIGLAGAALPAYGVFMHMAVGTICALLIPILAIFLLGDEPVTMLLAISGIWFFFASLRSLSVHNASITQSFRLGHELRAANFATARLANTDGLTGLNNRRAFRNAATALLELSSREKRPATMMLIDIDNFKQINDRYGHSVGDAALLRLAATLTQQLRGSDLCARIGGDEFAVLLPNTSVETARDVADKLRSTIQSEGNGPLRVGELSLSIGLAEGSALVEALLQRADAAMYEAKRSGKGRVVVAPAAS